MVPALEQLVDALSSLPTIGKKSAWRLAVHLLEQPADHVEHLAESLRKVKHQVHHCRRCFNYSQDELCEICVSGTRNESLICVVEKAIDVHTIESSGRYKGFYHVLGGILSPIHGITAEKIRIRELVERVRQDGCEELILALGGNTDAETTSLYLAKILADTNVKITRLARGLPAGMELEYVDQITLLQALDERIDFAHNR
ncbi:MAG: recombination protein RecR [Chitinivibrionales bacterium]|nr:recombination protein RecR [Chitinivibrionales bacterium]